MIPKPERQDKLTHAEAEAHRTRMQRWSTAEEILGLLESGVLTVDQDLGTLRIPGVPSTACLKKYLRDQGYIAHGDETDVFRLTSSGTAFVREVLS